VFNFPDYKRNANQNYSDIISPQFERPNPYVLLVGMQISATTMESSMEIPRKAKDRTAI
jgi:hypothetical protein